MNIHWSLALVTAATEDPIALEEAKVHLRVDGTDQDTLILALIKAATQYAERYLGRRLINSTWDLFLDRFPCYGEAIEIPYAPVSAVSSITYLDSTGTSQTWSSSDYITDLVSAPARITPAYDEDWPVTQSRMKTVTIRHIAGYGATPESVPEPILAGMKLLIGHLYENRELVVIGQNPAVLPMAIEHLWAPYVVWAVA